MKRNLTVLLGVTLALTAVLSVVRLSAQMAPADRAAVEKQLVANEQKISDAFNKKDIATLKTLIADDGFGIDPMMGTTSIGEMYKQLPTMDMKVTEEHRTDYKYIWVNPTTVILTYTWTGKATAMGQAMPSPTFNSTLYTKRGANWMAVFHQETVGIAAPKK
jgi:hypothetical protein